MKWDRYDWAGFLCAMAIGAAALTALLMCGSCKGAEANLSRTLYVQAAPEQVMAAVVQARSALLTQAGTVQVVAVEGDRIRLRGRNAEITVQESASAQTYGVDLLAVHWGPIRYLRLTVVVDGALSQTRVQSACRVVTSGPSGRVATNKLQQAVDQTAARFEAMLSKQFRVSRVP